MGKMIGDERRDGGWIMGVYLWWWGKWIDLGWYVLRF